MIVRDGWKLNFRRRVLGVRPLEHLYNRITNVVREKGYEDRITANITCGIKNSDWFSFTRLERRTLQLPGFQQPGRIYLISRL